MSGSCLSLNPNHWPRRPFVLRWRGLLWLFVALLISAVVACAPARVPPGPGDTEPRLESDRFVAADGLALPLRRWLPDREAWPRPRAVVLALHGFNDYSNAFEDTGAYMAARGLAVYAYDQRGFGAGPHAGLWGGREAMVADLRTASRLLARRHKGVPLFVLGESMGGAVAVLAFTSAAPPPAAGVILSAPAVWARGTMPWYQRATLWLSARLIPWARFSGRGLGVQASDNIEMLRGLGRDPLVIKETRVDAIDGLTDLMSEALAAAGDFKAPSLVLYGEKDEIVPRAPTLRFWRDLPEAARDWQRRALYAEGWHMLLRDLQADRVRADILAWVENFDAPLPSGADLHAEKALAEAAGDIVIGGAEDAEAAGAGAGPKAL